MTFASAGHPRTPTQRWFADGLRRVMLAQGLEQTSPDRAPRIVLHFVDREVPRPFRRRAQASFVVSVVEGPAPEGDILPAIYPLLVRTLGNMVIYLVPRNGRALAYVVTLEQGYFTIEESDDRIFFEKVYERLFPLASAQLVINNEFHPDLEPELWGGDELTAALAEAGRRLDALRLLPAAFPIEELLSPRDLAHVKRLFGIGGLSYGNLSARRDATRFWMSASGVNKGNLKVIGRDFLIVKGYDAGRNVILLSVPPMVEPRRVSVDAIEHWMIYTSHPGVGAIIHVHAWMDGVPSTQVQYPCGTRELAQAVSDLVAASLDPTRAVVGLRNHGLTITGPSIQDILERIEGRIIPRVPMS
ncbi:MAG: class II aldolase/adducin family protein [Armatimonadetes bacterium]|nr:class II aldolase/adducin family protein [Armatimonadota bacterium]